MDLVQQQTLLLNESVKPTSEGSVAFIHWLTKLNGVVGQERKGQNCLFRYV